MVREGLHRIRQQCEAIVVLEPVKLVENDQCRGVQARQVTADGFRRWMLLYVDAKLAEDVPPKRCVVVLGAAVDDSGLELGEVPRIEELGQHVGKRRLPNPSLTEERNVLSPLRDRTDDVVDLTDAASKHVHSAHRGGRRKRPTNPGDPLNLGNVVHWGP
jgi:hypothetical protein